VTSVAANLRVSEIIDRPNVLVSSVYLDIFEGTG
jgi:hypothetical protein